VRKKKINYEKRGRRRGKPYAISAWVGRGTRHLLKYGARGKEKKKRQKPPKGKKKR